MAQFGAVSVAQQHAPRVAELLAGGARLNSVAHSLEISWAQAKAAASLARAGGTPGPVPTGRKRGEPGPQDLPYVRVSDEVARRRDVGQEMFPQIAAALDISVATAVRAYDWEQGDGLLTDLSQGRSPDRGRARHLGKSVHDELQRLLRLGSGPAEAAAQAGCSVRTAYRALRDDSSNDPAANSWMTWLIGWV